MDSESSGYEEFPSDIEMPDFTSYYEEYEEEQTLRKKNIEKERKRITEIIRDSIEIAKQEIKKQGYAFPCEFYIEDESVNKVLFEELSHRFPDSLEVAMREMDKYPKYYWYSNKRGFVGSHQYYRIVWSPGRHNGSTLDTYEIIPKPSLYIDKENGTYVINNS